MRKIDPDEARQITARPDNLAFCFQEPTTAVMRLRSGRQAVSNVSWFRDQLRESLKAAIEKAHQSGYSSEDVRLGAFAVVALIDETILSLPENVSAEWSRKTLQEELFSTNLAGEIFYQNVERLHSRADSAHLADLLEVYQLSLLLGFAGRYSIGNPGDMHAVLSRLRSRIARIRGPLPPLSPHGTLAAERQSGAVRPPRDPWLIAACAAAILLLLVFAGFKLALSSDTDAVQSVAIRGS